MAGRVTATGVRPVRSAVVTVIDLDGDQVDWARVEPDGSYRKDLPIFGGEAIVAPDGKDGPANVSVIKQLAWAGALLAKGKIKHSYPHSWRSKAPVIYRNTPQWFAAIDRDLNDGMDDYGQTIRQRALTSRALLPRDRPGAR